MNRFIPSAIAVTVATLLQIAIAPRIAIFGVVPNFLVLVVVSVALVEGPVAGCVAGFAGGLLLDLAGSQPVGPYALVLCVVGYVAGLLEANLFAEGWRLPVTVVAIASLAAEVAYGLILAIVGGVPFWQSLWRVAIPTALYTSFLAVLTYPWLARVLRRDQSIRSFKRVA